MAEALLDCELVRVVLGRAPGAAGVPDAGHRRDRPAARAGDAAAGPDREARRLARTQTSIALPTTEDTEAFGRRLAIELAAGDLVVLDGPLGAGKTALARGIAAGLGVLGRVSSPTFIIAREHRAGERPGGGEPVAMVHVDAYRLGLGGAAGSVAAPRLSTNSTRWTSTPTWPVRWWWWSGVRAWSSTSLTGTCWSVCGVNRSPTCAPRMW